MDSRIRGNDSFSSNGVCGAFISADLLSAAPNTPYGWLYDFCLVDDGALRGGFLG